MTAIETLMLIVIQTQTDLIQKMAQALTDEGIEPSPGIDDDFRKLSYAMGRYERQLEYEMKKLSGVETH